MTTAATTARAEEILAQVEEKFGFRPNLLKEMVRSPAVASTYLAGQEAMAEASLTGGEAQAVQLTVATFNECHYCGAAHSTLARQMGLAEEDVEAIRSGELPSDERLAEVVRATRLVLENRGWLEAEELGELEAAGIERPQLYEIVAFVGLKTISNYINHIAGTEVDPQFAGA